jgi:hypothetical protein
LLHHSLQPSEKSSNNFIDLFILGMSLKALKFGFKRIDKFFRNRVFRLFSDEEKIMKALFGIVMKRRRINPVVLQFPEVLS